MLPRTEADYQTLFDAAEDIFINGLDAETEATARGYSACEILTIVQLIDEWLEV